MCESCIRHNYPEVAERLRSHFADEPKKLAMMLGMTPEMAARYDTGDLENSDPRLQVANKVWGRRYGRGDYSYQ